MANFAAIVIAILVVIIWQMKRSVKKQFVCVWNATQTHSIQKSDNIPSMVMLKGNIRKGVVANVVVASKIIVNVMKLKFYVRTNANVLDAKILKKAQKEKH